MLRIILALFLSLNLLSASTKIRTEELDYKKSIIQYYHSGAKVKIKLKSLPRNTAQVIISAVNSGDRPKVFIIGSRNLEVATDGSIEFMIELEDLKPGSYNTKSSEVLITLYSYEEEKLIIGEKAQLFIRPIICSDEGDGLCATVEIECHKGQQNCSNRYENQTFKNQCEMTKHEGHILHTGPCLSP